MLHGKFSRTAVESCLQNLAALPRFYTLQASTTGLGDPCICVRVSGLFHHRSTPKSTVLGNLISMNTEVSWAAVIASTISIPYYGRMQDLCQQDVLQSNLTGPTFPSSSSRVIIINTLPENQATRLTKPRTSHIGINWITQTILGAKATLASQIPCVNHTTEDVMYVADPILCSMLSFSL